MNIATATAALDVPANMRNNNCVMDAQWRLRDALKLAARRHTADADAPTYVVQAVADLRSWLR